MLYPQNFVLGLQQNITAWWAYRRYTVFTTITAYHYMILFNLNLSYGKIYTNLEDLFQ